MQSRSQLTELSGYADRPEDFDDLIRLLSIELRLITPAESGEHQSEHLSPAGSENQPQNYQLTHDYLVPSLREWIVRQQRMTLIRAGRAAAVNVDGRWKNDPKNRNLPGLLDWCIFRMGVRSRDRKDGAIAA